ncbi:hypothetical protein, partial [Pseudomonas aeruginosa]|uniref:hypothetical protein n=1 Tax=Pseudomonas aeruginosa TaxID=287 RepID=UPI0019696BE3
KQLNTWVSFQSAEQPLLGQFSVSGNMYRQGHWSSRIEMAIAQSDHAKLRPLLEEIAFALSPGTANK